MTKLHNNLIIIPIIFILKTKFIKYYIILILNVKNIYILSFQPVNILTLNKINSLFIIYKLMLNCMEIVVAIYF